MTDSDVRGVLRGADRGTPLAGNNDVFAASHLVLTAHPHGDDFDFLACGQESLQVFLDGPSHFNIVLG